MTPEAKVKKRVKSVLDDLGAYWTMPHGAGYGSAGVPDFLACFRGMFVGIECKAKDNKPTALQTKHLNDIQRCGGFSFVVDETNVSELSRKLQELIK